MNTTPNGANTTDRADDTVTSTHMHNMQQLFHGQDQQLAIAIAVWKVCH